MATKKMLTEDSAAAQAQDSGSVLGGALSATYAPTQRAMPKGPRLAATGDSIIASGVGLNERLFEASIQSDLAWRSEGRLTLARNAGVAGNTTAQMLARFDTDVTPWGPDVVLIRGGINDTATGVTFETFQANIAALVAKTYAIGAVPVLDTMTPVDYADATQNAKIVAWNKWLLDWTYRNGIRCGNSWAAAVAPVALTWPDATYTTDGLHPNTVGRKVIVDALLLAISDMPKWPHKREALATGALYPNALFTADTNADGVADNWTISGTSTATTPAYSTVTDAAFVGKAQRITVPQQTGAKKAQLNHIINVSSPTTYSAGDIMRVSVLCRVTSTNTVLGNTVRGGIVLLAWAQSSYDVIAQFKPEHGLVRVTFEYKVRTVPNDQQFTISAVLTTGTEAGNTGGAGYLDFGELEVINLTRQGLAPTYPFTV